MFKYFYTNKNIFWDTPVIKYVPNPFINDNWLNFQQLPESAKVNFLNLNNVELFIPFDNLDNITYIKVENEKQKLYYFIDKIKLITKTGTLYNLRLDYYMTYCVYLIQCLNKSNIYLKRLGQPKVNIGDHVLLNNFKANILNDNIIKTDELLYTSIYHRRTIVDRDMLGLQCVQGNETNPKQIFYLAGRPGQPNITKYGMYMVFLYKNKETPESVYHCFPIINYDTNEYTIGNANAASGWYLGNCLMTPIPGSTRYGLTRLLQVPEYQNSFIGVFRGPMLTMRQLANKNYDYFYYLISSGFGETGYIFISMTNLQSNNFMLNFRDPNVSIIDHNIQFFKDPWKLFQKIIFFNEELFYRDLFSFSLTTSPTFNTFFNNGFCFTPSYVNNENGYQQILTNGSVLATNTSNLIDGMINNRNVFNSGLIQQGFSLVNRSASPSNWNWGGVVSGVLGGVQGIADLTFKNSINEANLKNTAQNVNNLDYKKSQDYFKLINILTMNLNNGDNLRQYFWLNEPVDRDKQKINLLYDENGMLFNNNINLENYINTIKNAEADRKYLPILIDWTFYIYKIRNCISTYNTDKYFPKFESEIIKRCIELMSNSLIITIKNEI